MFRKILLTVVLTALILPALSQDGFDQLFRDQDWLVENIDREDVVLIHVGTAEDYNTGHIGDARLITTREFSRTVGNLRWEIPDAEAFKERLQTLGVTNETTNIIYFGNEVFETAFRMYFTMKYFGLAENTYILDGGLPGWYAKNRSTSTAAVKPIEDIQELTLDISNTLIAYKDEVLRSSGDSTVKIIDARRNNYYTGEEDGDGYYKRSGHIPGAVNITWLDLFDENKFIKPRYKLAEYFSDFAETDKVITYCHVGLRATVLHAVSQAMGFEALLYDGSFNEWDTLEEEYPVSTGNN